MTFRPLVSQKRDLNSVNVSLTPLCITLWWQSLIMSLVDVVITCQPHGKFSCFRERLVAKSSLAPQDSIHVPDYSRLSPLLFEVQIQRQRLLRLQYPQWFTEQHFTGKTSRTNSTNRLRRQSLNAVHKAYDVGSYSAQFREITVVFTVYDTCYAYLRCVCHKECVWFF